MCYSNSLTSKTESFKDKYKLSSQVNFNLDPTYYVSAFTHPLWPVITDQGVEMMEWGLIPSWFRKDPKEIHNNTLNARIETVHEKASFKNVIERNHCLIPSTGFFEWQTLGKTKVPYFITVKDQPLYSFAGIYDTWVNPQGKTVKSFSMLTSEANELMAEIHNTKKRMPIILPAQQEDAWVHHEMKAQDLQLFPSEEMKAIEISRKIINSPQPNRKEVQEEFHNKDFFQGSLF